jgi:hypothetical protein
MNTIKMRVKSNEEIFDKFKHISGMIMHLSALVQNPGTIITLTELLELNRDFGKLIEQMKSLLNEVNGICKPITE